MSMEILREISSKLETITNQTQELVAHIRARRAATDTVGTDQLELLPRGRFAHRLGHNKYEAVAAAHWATEDRKWDYLGHLMGDSDGPGTVTDRDRVVVATLIQWLGSNVGRCFLRELVEQFSAAAPRKGEW